MCGSLREGCDGGREEGCEGVRQREGCDSGREEECDGGREMGRRKAERGV